MYADISRQSPAVSYSNGGEEEEEEGERKPKKTFKQIRCIEEIYKKEIHQKSLSKKKQFASSNRKQGQYDSF